MFYVYDKKEINRSDPYTIPVQHVIVKNKKTDVDSILKRVKYNFGVNNRNAFHSVRTSHFYKDISSIRSSRDLSRALSMFRVNAPPAEIRKLYRAFDDGLGGFDFRQFTHRVFCNQQDRRKYRNLDRPLVMDTRSTTVYSIRARPQIGHMSPNQKRELSQSLRLSKSVQRSLGKQHELSAYDADAKAPLSQPGPKTSYPYSLPDARSDVHEFYQLHPNMNANTRIKTAVSTGFVQSSQNARSSHGSRCSNNRGGSRQGSRRSRPMTAPADYDPTFGRKYKPHPKKHKLSQLHHHSHRSMATSNVLG